MRKLFFLSLLCTSLFLTNCGGRNSDQNSSTPKTEEELRHELKCQEQNNPLKYLSDEEVTLEKEVKLFKESHKGTIIGYIINSATLAKYKDVTVKVTYFSRTDTEIDSEEYVFYNYYEPNSRNKFTLNVTYPKAYDSFSFEVTGATPVYE